MLLFLTALFTLVSQHDTTEIDCIEDKLGVFRCGEHDNAYKFRFDSKKAVAILISKHMK